MFWELLEGFGIALIGLGVAGLVVGGVISIAIIGYVTVRTTPVQWKSYFDGDNLGQIERKVWEETMAASKSSWAGRAGTAFAFGWFVIVLGFLLVFVARLVGKGL